MVLKDVDTPTYSKSVCVRTCNTLLYMFMCWAVLSFTETSWLKALAAGCPNTLEMVVVEEDKLHIKQDSRKPYLKQMFAIQQCRQSTTAACVFALVWVWLVSFGLCGGRRFPVIPFMQPKSKPEQLIRREAHPYNPSFPCYTLSRSTWAGSCSECLHDVASCPLGSWLSVPICLQG